MPDQKLALDSPKVKHAATKLPKYQVVLGGVVDYGIDGTVLEEIPSPPG